MEVQLLWELYISFLEHLKHVKNRNALLEMCCIFLYKYILFIPTVTKEDIMKASWEIFDAAKN